MYQVFKSKKNPTGASSASAAANALSHDIQQLHVNEASHRVDDDSSAPAAGASASNQARKRIDGNSNLDDSGTFLPSIL
jgi:hypothetical protein